LINTILKNKLKPVVRKKMLNIQRKKRRTPIKEVCIGVKIENIKKTTILNIKSIRDIVTELNTTTSLGNLIFNMIPALVIKDVKPMRMASLNIFIIIIPRSKPIL
jgi:NurA-like 5'-3' nuclease